ncbi:hypothetical protein MA9V1_093 [Chryseobacterium phage MA9V-1]|nr:hypothetical protein MA9V1_093 [Chryseobacterium phage MA9V-1]
MLDLRDPNKTIEDFANEFTSKIKRRLTETSANKKQTRSEFLDFISDVLDEDYQTSDMFNVDTKSCKLSITAPGTPVMFKFKIKLNKTDRTRKVSNTRLAYLYTFESIEVAEPIERYKTLHSIVGLYTQHYNFVEYIKLQHLEANAFDSYNIWKLYVTKAMEWSANNGNYLGLNTYLLKPNDDIFHHSRANGCLDAYKWYIGCSIVARRLDPKSNSEAITFAKTVFDLFEEHGNACHDFEAFAMRLVSYYKLQNNFKENEQRNRP